MTSTLRYGANASLELDLTTDVLVANCDAPRGAPVQDTADAVATALETPIDFPPLVKAVVLGDRVTLALSPGVPQAGTIVAATIRALQRAGIAAEDITLVHTGDPPPPGFSSAIEAARRQGLEVLVHDPADTKQLCFVANTDQGKPIHIHRAIYDADVVIPIGCLQVEGSLGYHGPSAGLFPTFADAKSLERFRSPSSWDSPPQRKRLRREAEDASWLLGALFTVQVVPGARDEILHVLAGELRSVMTLGRQLCDDAWSYSVPRRASLVVAAIEGDASNQTWDNVARALDAASRAVAEDGSIALCTELEMGLGPALQRLAGADDARDALRDIAKERPADVLPATQLAHALERGRVYLLSRLDEAVVEELGVAPVASPQQIARLTARHDSCILLANAQHAIATPADEE